MPDTAFDPFAPDEGGDVQIAQAPPPRVSSSFDPFAGQPSGPPQGQAVQTAPPPALTPGVQQQPKQVWGDEDDKREINAADANEKNTFFNPNNVLSHRNFQPLVPQSEQNIKQRLENHPLYRQWATMQEALPKASKDEQRRYKPVADRLYQMINKDLNAEDHKTREQAQIELKQIDAHYEDPTKRDQTASTIATHVDAKAKELEALRNHRDPTVSKQAAWDYTVSPLNTMSGKASPDGKPNYVALRDAVTSVAMLNRISNEKAIDLTLAIGSPVGYDDKTGEWAPGANGRKGAGATFYKPLGTDMNGNAVVQIGNDRFRVPIQTMQQLREARDKGYLAARKLKAEAEAAKEPGMVGRTLEWGAKKLGIQ